jgi:hypothetical protein
MIQLGDYVRVYYGKHRQSWWVGEVTRLLKTGSVDAQYWRGAWMDFTGQQLRTARVQARDIHLLTPVEWETYLPQQFLQLRVVKDASGYAIHVSGTNSQQHRFASTSLEEAQHEACEIAKSIIYEQAAKQHPVEWVRHGDTSFADFAKADYMGYMQLRVREDECGHYIGEVHAYKTLTTTSDFADLKQAQEWIIGRASQFLRYQRNVIDQFVPGWRVQRAV